MRGPTTSGTVAVMRRSLLGLALLTVAAGAWAQAAPPRAPDAAPAAKPKAAAESDSLDDDDAPPAKKAAEPPAKDEPRRDEPAPPPPPADPRMDEQEPRPFFGVARGDQPERHVEIGPDVGVWSRPAEGNGVSYAPGLAYGAHARVELWRFLGFRVYANQSSHAVDVPRSALGLDDTQIEQPDLEVFQLGARAEPTYMPMPTLRLWAGLGVAWARATAPEPSSSGATAIHYADRSGVLLEYSAALGATWDFVPRWLAATASVSGGLIRAQTGDLFNAHTVNDGAGGTRRMGGLPEFESSFSALLGVGMIL